MEMVYRVVGRIHVCVHEADTLNDATWIRYLDDIGRQLDQLDGIYSLTYGAGPGASQREYARKFWASKKRKLPIAVVTPSPFVRALAGALHFMFGGQVKPFAPEEREAAFKFLSLGAAQREAVIAALKDLEQQLGMGR